MNVSTTRRNQVTSDLRSCLWVAVRELKVKLKVIKLPSYGYIVKKGFLDIFVVT